MALRPALDVRFEVYGRGDSEPALAERVAAAGLAERVTFRGRIPFEEVPGVLAGADIGLAPTRLDDYTRYSLSTKLFEYGAMGKPVVATRLPLVERIFGTDTVRTYEPGDAEDLARTILDLVDHPARRAASVKRTAARIAELSWEREAPRYLAIVESLAPDGLSSGSDDPDGAPKRAVRAPGGQVTSDSKLAIIGLGYVGLPLAISFVEAGLDVVGVDASARRVTELKEGRSPIDDIADERLRAALVAGLRIVGTADANLGEADVMVVCVPTPIDKAKVPDLGPGPLGRRAHRRRPAARPARDPPVDDVPGHDDGPVPDGARADRSRRRPRLRPRIRPRAGEPGRPGQRAARPSRASSAGSPRPRRRARRRSCAGSTRP